VDAGPVDGLGVKPLSVGLWALLALLTAALAGVAAWLGARANLSRGKTDRARQARLGRLALGLWVVASAAFLGLLVYTPLFDGFFPVQWQEGRPTYGTGGVLWASMTLSLLTLPVVIVATEEALAAVPNSMREGSYACGASKWQTIQRIVLPRAMPGIMTGMILAMARGAGEVAPLMLVGAVKLAPHLPVDGVFPYVHPERSFMHLGFHIYDVGFQSQNSEAAKPMVFTTTLLLILIITTLNVAAIWIRARLRRKFSTGQF
jgi:phosphate transport system permease protein